MWIAIGLSSSILIFILLYLTRKNRLLYLPFLIFVVCLSAICTRIFVFEIYNIPSNSMENALFVNNKIIVNKLAYGPKLPMSLEDIPWINVISKVTRNKKIDYIRLGGLSKIKRNDIIVFKMPINNKKNLVKRCIGLPGEKIKYLGILK